MTMRFASLVAFVASFVPCVAFAAAEPVRLVVDAPSNCLGEAELVADLSRLGATPTIADEGERARRFVVSIDDHFETRLVVRDLVGRETTRSVKGASCGEARQAAALLVSIALDEEEGAPAREAPSTFRWPEPVASPPREKPLPPRAPVGAGGLVLSGLYGLSSGLPGGDDHGARAIAAWRVGRVRLGGVITFHHETRGAWRGQEPPMTIGDNGRAGWIFGLGAPWNDNVAGFLFEGGVLVGRSVQRTAGYRTETTTERRWVSPSFGTTLFLQLPWKGALRPVAGLGTAVTPFAAPDRKITHWAELGIVWQAW